MLDRIEQIVKILGFIVGISAVVVAWLAYQNDVQQEKINKSFELFYLYQNVRFFTCGIRGWLSAWKKAP